MVEPILLVLIVLVAGVVFALTGAWIAWRIGHNQSPMPPILPQRLVDHEAGEIEPTDLPEKRVRP